MTITYSEGTTIRLDKFLTDKYPTHSRSQIQKLVKNGEILVDQKKVLPHHFLKNGEELQLPDFLGEDKVAVKIGKPQANKKIVLNILNETDDYLVINKPAGLLVHPTNKNETDTLVNALLAYFPAIKTVGDNAVRPGIVHRLDRDVSGVMVVAKTQEMFDCLKQQFIEREISKKYLGLVYGEMSQSSGQIDLPIGKSLQSGKMAVRSKTEIDLLSKEALTIYEVLQQFQHYALLKIEIKTGRTHQIRAHMNAVGHSVVGDKIYCPKNLKSRVELGRIFLHANILGFFDLNKEWQEFTVDLPEDLKEFLEKLA